MKTWTWFALGVGVIGLGLAAFNTASGRLAWQFDATPAPEAAPEQPGPAVDAPAAPVATGGIFGGINPDPTAYQPTSNKVILEV